MEDLLHYLLEEFFPAFFVTRVTESHYRVDIPQKGVASDKLMGLLNYCRDHDLATQLDKGETDVVLAVIVPLGA